MFIEEFILFLDIDSYGGGGIKMGVELVLFSRLMPLVLGVALTHSGLGVILL